MGSVIPLKKYANSAYLDLKNLVNNRLIEVEKLIEVKLDSKVSLIKKMSDYGSAWRILRLPSLTDQIFIKAQRIRQLQENAVRKVDEGERGEFIGIINYCSTYNHGYCSTYSN